MFFDPTQLLTSPTGASARPVAAAAMPDHATAFQTLLAQTADQPAPGRPSHAGDSKQTGTPEPARLGVAGTTLLVQGIDTGASEATDKDGATDSKVPDESPAQKTDAPRHKFQVDDADSATPSDDTTATTAQPSPVTDVTISAPPPVAPPAIQAETTQPAAVETTKEVRHATTAKRSGAQPANTADAATILTAQQDTDTPAMPSPSKTATASDKGKPATNAMQPNTASDKDRVAKADPAPAPAFRLVADADQPAPARTQDQAPAPQPAPIATQPAGTPAPMIDTGAPAPSPRTTATPPPPAPPQTAMSQVSIDTIGALGLQIHKKLSAQSTKFALELKPADLGRVEVALTIGRDGKLNAHLQFDSPVTAAAFSAQESELRQQLANTGLVLDGNAFTFSNRDGTQQQTPRQTRRQSNIPASAGDDEPENLIADLRSRSTSSRPALNLIV